MTSWIQSNPRKSKNINVNAVMHCMLSFIILKRTKELTLKTKPTVLNKFIIMCISTFTMSPLHAYYMLHMPTACFHYMPTACSHYMPTAHLHYMPTARLHYMSTACLHYMSTTYLHLHVYYMSTLTCLYLYFLFSLCIKQN